MYKLEPSPCFPVCQFMTSSCHVFIGIILTHPPSYSVNQGQVATKHILEIISEFKEIKQRNEVVKKA